ncbi:hypothetical protein CIPAW_09G020100 [Carya illinoinensis]|uniref:Uncharacterized protein n=1 Tax=Carya illinoinensis TaxID=32201 RepID=A0A8T1PD24_CARIL|nr:hypothetical protein CIPAW_09G020100 [Carya illinoinensis]
MRSKASVNGVAGFLLGVNMDQRVHISDGVLNPTRSRISD